MVLQKFPLKSITHCKDIIGKNTSRPSQLTFFGKPHMLKYLHRTKRGYFQRNRMYLINCTQVTMNLSFTKGIWRNHSIFKMNIYNSLIYQCSILCWIKSMTNVHYKILQTVFSVKVRWQILKVLCNRQLIWWCILHQCLPGRKMHQRRNLFKV